MQRSTLVRLRSLVLSALFATAAPLAGCVGDLAPEAAEPPVSVEWDVLPRIARGEYRRGDFVQVNQSAYGSTVAAGNDINVFVSTDAADAFAQIDPAIEGSGVELPRGAVIVREVWEGGMLDKLTVMARMDEGYSPDHGDWWFGVLARDGWPIRDDDGTLLIGPLVERCASCHAQRATDGFLFGVPGTNRNPAL